MPLWSFLWLLRGLVVSRRDAPELEAMTLPPSSRGLISVRPGPRRLSRKMEPAGCSSHPLGSAQGTGRARGGPGLGLWGKLPTFVPAEQMESICSDGSLCTELVASIGNWCQGFIRVQWMFN